MGKAGNRLKRHSFLTRVSVPDWLTNLIFPLNSLNLRIIKKLVCHTYSGKCGNTSGFVKTVHPFLQICFKCTWHYDLPIKESSIPLSDEKIPNSPRPAKNVMILEHLKCHLFLLSLVENSGHLFRTGSHC